jgi:hypothetical protein
VLISGGATGKLRDGPTKLLWGYGVIEIREEDESIEHAVIFVGVKTTLGFGNW